MSNAFGRIRNSTRARYTAIGALRRSGLPLEMRSRIYQYAGFRGTTRRNQQSRQSNVNRQIRTMRHSTTRRHHLRGSGLGLVRGRNVRVRRR